MLATAVEAAVAAAVALAALAETKEALSLSLYVEVECAHLASSLLLAGALKSSQYSDRHRSSLDFAPPQSLLFGAPKIVDR